MPYLVSNCLSLNFYLDIQKTNWVCFLCEFITYTLFAYFESTAVDFTGPLSSPSFLRCMKCRFWRASYHFIVFREVEELISLTVEKYYEVWTVGVRSKSIFFPQKHLPWLLVLRIKRRLSIIEILSQLDAQKTSSRLFSNIWRRVVLYPIHINSLSLQNLSHRSVNANSEKERLLVGRNKK